MHADSDGIIFYSTLYLWHQNAGGPLQFYLASFLVVLKILLLIFAGNLLKQKLVLFRVRLNRLWLGFTTRFWISTTELFATMNSFPITEKKKFMYQWICGIQIIWKLSYLILLRITVFELFEHWTMLVVFLFLVLTISKFYSWISEKHPTSKNWTSNFVVGVL